MTTTTELYLALFGTTLLASLLGILIVFQAYRGYRRNNSTRMLYLAIGFACLTLVPFALSLVVTVIASALPSGEFLRASVLPLASRIVEIIGLSIILYSLYENHG